MKHALAGALIVVAIARIASTFTVLSATADEPMHISAGLQLLAEHRYSYQLENPPLPRAVMAFAPWLGGMQFDPKLGLSEQLRRVFYTGGSYERNLVLARLGNLLFFALAAIATWLWARRLLGDTGALVALLLFTLQPVVLGYSGLATHDAAAMAGVALALAAFGRWLDDTTLKNAILSGAAFGFAVACKFSAIGYVPAAWLAMLLVRRRMPRPTHVIAAAFASVFVLAASYGFLPRNFIVGMQSLIELNRAGHTSYLFGEVGTTGWWWYFPATIGLKTTLALLVLIALSWVAWRERGLREPLAAAMAILAVAMTGHLDLGIRYVLPVFVPLSIAAAAVVMHLKRPIAIALVVWHCVASIVAHPDYFPYFNELAGRDPSRYLIDSNLEWGQDVLRLADAVGSERVGVHIMGLNDLRTHGINAYQPNPFVPVNGPVAVGEHSYRMLRAEGGWWWLVHQPYRRIGKSIRLYDLP